MGLHLLRRLDEQRASFFWPLWCVLTVAFSLFAAWRLRRVPLEASGLRCRGPIRLDRFWATWVPLAVLAVFLCAYFAEALIGEDFVWYDNSQLTRYSLRGVDFPPPIWPQAGRFFPMSNQEFNWLAHFTKSITAYHAVGLVEVFIIALMMLFLADRISVAGRVALTIFLLTTTTIAVSVTDLIYPERNVVFFLVCLIFATRKFEDTHSRWWAIAAVTAAQIALYFKEPVFLLVLGFTGARIGFRALQSRSSNGRFDWFGLPESRLDFCMAGQAAAFVIVYAFMMLPDTRAEYLVTFRRPSVSDAVLYYLKIDFLVWVFSAVTLARLFLIFRRKAAPWLLWDGIACGGLVYFTAFLTLRMTHFYYLAPVDLIAGAYLGLLLSSSWPKTQTSLRAAAAVLVTVIAAQNLQQTALHMMSRKYIVRKKQAIAKMIVEKYRRDPASGRSLYFPFSGGYVLGEFAAYLAYLGVPVEEDGTESSLMFRPSGTVALFAPKLPTTGHCIFFVTFVCHASQPDGARVTIALPDDPVLPSEVNLRDEADANLRAFDPHAQPSARFMHVLRILQDRRWNWE